MCLSENASSEEYLALSYVWGQIKTLKTTKATIESFKQSGSLREDQIAAQIPRTIQDEIALT